MNDVVGVGDVLVTGGAGYIGDAVVSNLLEAGCSVVVLDDLLYSDSYMRPDVKFHKGDIRDSNILYKIKNKYQITHVIHLAAIVGDGACAVNPYATVDVNEKATENLASIFSDCRFIFASTCSVYGQNNNVLTEESTPNPLSIYAGTKLSAEKFVTNVENHVVFRLGTLFGMSTPFARIRADLVANIMTFMAFENKPLNVFGGEQWRPIVHVKDVGRIIAESAIEDSFTGTYILSRDNYKIVDIAMEIGSLTGGSVVTTKSKFEDLRNYKVDGSKLVQYNSSEISLSMGVREMLKFLENGRIKNVWNPLYHNAKYTKEVIYG